MPSFSPHSLAQLATCDERLQRLFNEVIKTWDCTIIEGNRSQADQEADFAAGKTKLHYPNGKHNAIPSRAVDVAPDPIDWNDTKKFYFFAGFVLGTAQQMGIIIRYGGDWNGDHQIGAETFPDLPHFELNEP